MQQSEGGRLYIYLTWEKKDAAAVFWDLPAKEISFQSLDDIREREREGKMFNLFERLYLILFLFMNEKSTMNRSRYYLFFVCTSFVFGCECNL